MKKSFLRCFAVGAVFLLGAMTLPVRAEELPAVKTRMAQRLSKLDGLKAGGAVGENNRGFVEVRGGGGESASVVADENRDREQVYAAIAPKAGSTADQVGRARAKQISAASAKGVWVQHEDGTWTRK